MKMHECDKSAEFRTLELFVFSDLHVGDPLFNRDLFASSRDWILAAPNRFCILNGDIMNVALKDSVSDVYGDTLSPAEQLKWCKTQFAPLRDRILAITEGNHEARIARSTSIHVLESLAESLGLVGSYFPDGVLLKLTFGTKPNNKRQCYTVYCTHGRGGGAMQGGKALRMARMANVVQADVYIMGHTHWKAAFKESMFVPDLYNNNVRLVEQTFVNSSAMIDWGGYSQVAGYKPTCQGSPYLTFHADPKRVTVTL